MIEAPDRWAPQYVEAGAGSVTFHVERRPLRQCACAGDPAKGARASLALKPATPIEPYEDLLPELDMLLIMTVEPGFGGQAFLDIMPWQIRRTRVDQKQRSRAVAPGRRQGVGIDDRAVRRRRRRSSSRVPPCTGRPTRPKRYVHCAREAEAATAAEQGPRRAHH